LLQSVLEHGDFLNIDISQGSAATCLRCGGIFKYGFITNFYRVLTVKKEVEKIENRLTFGEAMDKSITVLLADLVALIYAVRCINVPHLKMRPNFKSI